MNILFWDKNSIFYLIEKYLLQLTVRIVFLAMWQPASTCMLSLIKLRYYTHKIFDRVAPS